MEYGASVLRVVDGRTIQVIRISKCADFKRAMDKHHHAQEIMKEKMPGLDPNTVSVKAKPKENSEQVLLYHVCHSVTVGLHRTFFILRIVCWTRGNEL